MKIKALFRILLIIVALFLALLTFKSIVRPEKFRTIYELRKKEIANRLITLRAAEAVFKTEYKRYTADIDSLVDFANNGFVSIVKNVGALPEGMSEADALKKGILKKEITKVPAIAKILEIDPNVQRESLKHFHIIPETGNKKFEIQLGAISSKTYKIPTYKVVVDLDDILANMQKTITPDGAGSVLKLWNSLIYAGLQNEKQYKTQYDNMTLGSLTESNTSGSWE